MKMGIFLFWTSSKTIWSLCITPCECECVCVCVCVWVCVCVCVCVLKGFCLYSRYSVHTASFPASLQDPPLICTSGVMSSRPRLSPIRTSVPALYTTMSGWNVSSDLGKPLQLIKEQFYRLKTQLHLKASSCPTRPLHTHQAIPTHTCSGGQDILRLLCVRPIQS